MAPAGGRAELVERAYGAGKPGLNLNNIRSLSIPLPPLAEQHRIVHKVDELMALCDRLGDAFALCIRYRCPHMTSKGLIRDQNDAAATDARGGEAASRAGNPSLMASVRSGLLLDCARPAVDL